MSVLFDDSIRILVEALKTSQNTAFVEGGVIVRDTTGRLSFVSSQASPTPTALKKIIVKLRESLGPYARADRVLAFADDPGVNSLLKDHSALPINVEGTSCRLIDRRVVGTGWLEEPMDPRAVPPRIVFASLKGGVGRSTALAVAAADLARRNQNVLVVDLDLEAPGIADLLLTSERMPTLGVTDFLVENGIGGVPNGLLDEFIGLSAFTTGGGGRVQVVPAFGARASTHPESVLAKLARAMVDDVAPDGQVTVVSRQISYMIDRLVEQTEPDVVLIDSRAGLGELAAPAVLALGAVVLLFGTAQTHTIRGYRALFAGLKLLAQRDRHNGRSADWRLNLKAVHAKARLDEKVLAKYRDDLYDLFSREIYDEDRGLDALSLDDVNFDIDDEDAPHWPLLVPFNQAFIDFDPTQAPSQLTQTFYDQAFGPFL